MKLEHNEHTYKFYRMIALVFIVIASLTYYYLMAALEHKTPKQEIEILNLEIKQGESDKLKFDAKFEVMKAELDLEKLKIANITQP